MFFFQQKHVYLYIIDLFTGYDDDSKLNVTRDSNYYTMTWKSKIVKKKPKPMRNYHVALNGRVFITKRDCISAHAQSANRNEEKAHVSKLTYPSLLYLNIMNGRIRIK